MINAYGKQVTLDELKKCVLPGWHKLIEDLVSDLFKLGWDGRVHQVKEKFGTLRFYIGGSSDEIFDRICLAESESAETCEVCGTKENVECRGMQDLETEKHYQDTRQEDLLNPYAWIVTRCLPCRLTHQTDNRMLDDITIPR